MAFHQKIYSIILSEKCVTLKLLPEKSMLLMVMYLKHTNDVHFVECYINESNKRRHREREREYVAMLTKSALSFAKLANFL